MKEVGVDWLAPEKFKQYGGVVLVGLENCPPCAAVREALATYAESAWHDLAYGYFVLRSGDVSGRSALLRVGIKKYPRLLLMNGGSAKVAGALVEGSRVLFFDPDDLGPVHEDISSLMPSQ